MKKIMLLAAGLVALVSGCATTGSQTPAEVLANIQVQVTKACAVANPTLLSLQAMSTQMTADQAADLVKASTIVTEVCSAKAPAINSVQDLVNVAVPAAIRIIAASPMKDADKTTAEIALTAASVAVSAALAQYAPAVAVPASGAVAS
jgi:hypothetical protein